MPNALYRQMNANKAGADPIENTFMGFMEQMRGQNPRQIIDQLVASGQMSQQQLNAVQRKAAEMSNVFGRFKARFGY